ncbi:sulfiredoxin, chloroplastic/mitochondrial isoform X2 [Vitis riparia]|uniref:sulfiredoxin, chloroplastic/mitochondrial isoform X2 n=1 Tax=Vitis riparia TaxID=96939 RepID=UPI00155AD32E|nr:sulfiredoxin, chloroplastic/mitochondrial isoform X2 [Vitis riparia]
MGSFVVQFPSKLRNFTVWASPNNGVPFDSPQSRGPVILELPLDKIRRPLLRTRSNDPEKVKELMESIREIGLQVPIDVLEVDGAYYDCRFFRLSSVRSTPAPRAPNNSLQSSTWNERDIEAPPPLSGRRLLL